MLKLTAITLSLLLLSILGVLIDYGNFQNAFALTPVADLTGQWSGFAQVSFSGTDCWTSGKVNGFFKQNENNLHGEFSFVPTTGNPDCSYEPWGVVVDGTIDGSRITLFDHDGITFNGWYASSGIKLDFSAEWLTGTTQLSPTGFTLPPFQPKDEKKEEKEKVPVCKQGEVLVNGKCVPQQKEQPKEEKPIPKTSLETKNNQKIEVGKPFKTTKPDTIEDTQITVDEGTSLTLAYLQKYSEDGLSCGVYECPPQLDVEFGASIGKLVAAGIGVFIPTLNTPPVLSLILFLDEGRTFFSDLPKYLTGLEKEILVAIFAPDMIIVPGGTEFTVEVNKDGTKVTVFKDFVYVITEHSDKPLLVKANEFAFADKKEAYTKTEKIDSADKWWEKLSQQKERPNVPSWIKNNANWWSQGQLDDNEFLKGIEYMVEKDIILLPKEAKSAQSSDEQSFTPIKSKYLSTDSREYILPQTRGMTKDVLLKGHVDGYYRGEMVYLIIELPDKSTQQQEVLASNGDYSTRIALDRDSQVGEYKIKTVYKNSEVDSISFLVKKGQDKPQEQKSSSNVSKDVPKWIKNNAKWWSDGTISEEEFVNAIKFLVAQRIIQVK